MKPRWANQRNQAMTSFEVGVIIAVLLILVALLLPILSRDRRRVSRINCVNNLHQINLAYKIWEGDHSDNFPMGVSVTNGGSMELVVTGNVVETFVLMSNELS
ncbi:MAG: hypothetical protein ACREDQ_11500, partial [Limisphaerales bacterium]